MRITLCLLATLALSASAHAVIPPSVTQVTPAAGAALPNNTLTFRGYTLSAGDTVAVVDGAGKALAFSKKLSCKAYCRGKPGRCTGEPAPGSQQSRCVLTVKLPQPSKTAKATVTFLRSKIDLLAKGKRWHRAR